jgi:pimeloyl-ACP methyl ester carboxylesterase
MAVRPGGAALRWVELDGPEPVRVFLHGLGATSGAYFTQIAADPAVPRRRTLLVDLLGFGLSDRPPDFRYGLTDHADAVATLLRGLDVHATSVVGHSLGGSVAIVLAHRHPDLVGSLVVVEPNLDPRAPSPEHLDSRGIAHVAEDDFVAHGFRRLLDDVDGTWASTMRLADPVALHRTAVGLTAGTTPTMRQMLTALTVPRVLVEGGDSGPETGVPELVAAGVVHVVVPGAGHNVTLDRPAAFAAVLAAADR